MKKKMENKHILILIITLTALTISLTLLLLIHFCNKRRRASSQENVIKEIETYKEKDGVVKEELIKFHGGEDLNITDILEAPGEVIGKSNYGTLYGASLLRTNSLALLRFLRPACTLRIKEVMGVIELLGSVKHHHLVPLCAFYAGPRGEMLLVHPFYRYGTLAQFIRDGNAESRQWAIIYRISIGIARAVDYLHTALPKPIIHGNLKSKNVLMDRNFQPSVSDYGLHLLLNPTSGQQMLEAAAAQGYKAPELIKMKDVSTECDIYSIGVIFLELLTGKEPIDDNPTPDQDFYLPSILRTAILDHRISDLYHPDILLGHSNDERAIIKDYILQYFQIAMACCSPAPSLRPDIKQVLASLEDIGR